MAGRLHLIVPDVCGESYLSLADLQPKNEHSFPFFLREGSEAEGLYSKRYIYGTESSRQRKIILNNTIK